MRQQHIQRQKHIHQLNVCSAQVEPERKTPEISFDYRILQIHFPDFDSLLMAEMKSVKIGGILS